MIHFRSSDDSVPLSSPHLSLTADHPTPVHVTFLRSARSPIQNLSRVLARALGPVTEVSTPEELASIPAHEGANIGLVEYDSLTPGERDAWLTLTRQAPATMRWVLISSGAWREDMVRLLENGVLRNVVAMGPTELGHRVNVPELLTTVRKLVTGDIFGLDKYIAWGARAERVSIHSSAQREQVYDEARRFLAELQVVPRLAATYHNVLDEFLTNALYNAPVDGEGKRLFAHRSRDEVVELPEGQQVHVTLASDGEELCVAVSDPYGSMPISVAQRYLARCFKRGSDQIESKPGGAGMGLYLCANSLVQMILNVAPGRRTEFIGTLSIVRGYRASAQSAKSLNFFETRP